MLKIELDNGKYTIIEDLNNGEFKALRNGEEWRNLVGDNLILMLVYEIERLTEQHNEDLETIDQLYERIWVLENRQREY